jgi:hypothetical protein
MRVVGTDKIKNRVKRSTTNLSICILSNATLSYQVRHSFWTTSKCLTSPNQCLSASVSVIMSLSFEGPCTVVVKLVIHLAFNVYSPANTLFPLLDMPSIMKAVTCLLPFLNPYTVLRCLQLIEHCIYYNFFLHTRGLMNIPIMTWDVYETLIDRECSHI